MIILLNANTSLQENIKKDELWTKLITFFLSLFIMFERLSYQLLLLFFRIICKKFTLAYLDFYQILNAFSLNQTCDLFTGISWYDMICFIFIINFFLILQLTRCLSENLLKLPFRTEREILSYKKTFRFLPLAEMTKRDFFGQIPR